MRARLSSQVHIEVTSRKKEAEKWFLNNMKLPSFAQPTLKTYCPCFDITDCSMAGKVRTYQELLTAGDAEYGVRLESLWCNFAFGNKRQKGKHMRQTKINTYQWHLNLTVWRFWKIKESHKIYVSTWAEIFGTWYGLSFNHHMVSLLKILNQLEDKNTKWYCLYQLTFCVGTMQYQTKPSYLPAKRLA